MTTKIVVTGSDGFIGKLLTKELPSCGIDIRSGKNILSCKLPSADVVFHLAAQSDVQSSWEDPLHDLNNIRITARIAHEYPEAKIIYTNSCASIEPQSPYGFSKWASGEYLMRFHPNVVNCIFPNIYGNGSRSVVDIFKSSEEVTIFGDGNQTRDFVHVDDIVRGLILAKDWEPGTYFMGSGISTKIIDLAEGKYVEFLPARQELHEVVVPNTTPNWKPYISVFDYLNDA